MTVEAQQINNQHNQTQTKPKKHQLLTPQTLPWKKSFLLIVDMAFPKKVKVILTGIGNTKGHSQSGGLFLEFLIRN